MPKLDFPNPLETNPWYDEQNQVWWEWINGGWRRQEDFVVDLEANDGKEYCRKDKQWSEIVYPIAEDDPNDGGFYARRNNAWEAMVASAGPDPAISLSNPTFYYGLQNGSWAALPAGDNAYTKTEADALLAGKSNTGHTHSATDITTGLGTMAALNDAPSDGKYYGRKDGGWEDISAILPPAQKQHQSITVIDPIASDDAILMFTPIKMNILQVKAVALPSGAEVTFNIKHDSMADGSGGVLGQVFTADKTCTDHTGGQTFTVDTAAVPANRWLWLEIDDTYPPVNATMFHVTFIYEEDYT